VLGADGRLRDVSAAVPDFNANFFTGRLARRLEQALRDAPLLPGNPTPRFGVPIANVSKVVGVGMNYHEGVRRAGMTTPVEAAAVHQAQHLPRRRRRSDRPAAGRRQARLGGRAGRRDRSRLLEASTAHEGRDVVLGYCVFNDLSERRWQNEQGGEWCKGKSADGFGPMRPVVGHRRRGSRSRQARPLARPQRRAAAELETPPTWCSACASWSPTSHASCACLPGDIVIMGTPPGTGWRLDPPRFLRPGDRLSLGIQGLGGQNTVVV
jgi:2-keto-4-pentenoate hydratase/2-oxohepta-3-ene-1,7-dioic acid hydratase in catechol pathway